jgi:plastocyanin
MTQNRTPFDPRELVGPALLVFLAAGVALTFVVAFALSEGGGGEGEETVAEVTPTPAGTPSPGGLLVEMGDNFFEFEGEREPAIPVEVGEEVTFSLINNGVLVHNMHIDGTNNEYAVQICEVGGEEPCSDPNAMEADDTGEITFRLDEPGTYFFRCDFHPRQMTGTLVVE